MCLPGAREIQKGVSDSLEPELWVIVSHYVETKPKSARATGAPLAAQPSSWLRTEFLIQVCKR